MLGRAGCPPQVTTAYISCMETVKYRKSAQGALGCEAAKLCAIPQGCPLSMVTIALMRRPWLKGVQQQLPGACARALADDLLVANTK
eukprot:6850131-Alexandrium_andersonii.AAC.1